MNKRLAQFIDYLGISVRQFEVKISTSNGVIARFCSKNTSLRSEILENIHTAYPELSMEWLVTGRGSMIYEPSPSNDSNCQQLELIRVLQEQVRSQQLFLESLSVSHQSLIESINNHKSQ